MDYIDPRYKKREKVEWHISYRTRLIVDYYAKYTKYSESEVVDMFLENFLGDEDFVCWLKKRRSQKKIKNIIFKQDEKDESM